MDTLLLCTPSTNIIDCPLNTTHLGSRVILLEILISNYLRLFLRRKVQFLHHEGGGSLCVPMSGETLWLNRIKRWSIRTYHFSLDRKAIMMTLYRGHFRAFPTTANDDKETTHRSHIVKGIVNIENYGCNFWTF